MLVFALRRHILLLVVGETVIRKVREENGENLPPTRHPNGEKLLR